MIDSTSPDHRRDVDPDGHDAVGEWLDVDGQSELHAGLAVQVDAGGGDGLDDRLDVGKSRVEWKPANLESEIELIDWLLDKI